MSGSLFTLGFEAPGEGTGGGGGPGATGIRIFFQALNLSTGELEAGVDFSGAGEAQISLNGEDYVAIAGLAPHSVADGDYYYETVEDDGVIPPTVLLKIRKAGYAPQTISKDVQDPGITDIRDSILDAITSLTSTVLDGVTVARAELDARIDAQTATLAADVAALPTLTDVEGAIADAEPAIGAATLTAFRAWSHDVGVTFDGLMKRLEAELTGKKTEIVEGAFKRFKWYLKDGVTVAVESTVKRSDGERADADVEGSEP